MSECFLSLRRDSLRRRRTGSRTADSQWPLERTRSVVFSWLVRLVCRQLKVRQQRTPGTSGTRRRVLLWPRTSGAGRREEPRSCSTPSRWLADRRDSTEHSACCSDIFVRDFGRNWRSVWAGRAAQSHRHWRTFAHFQVRQPLKRRTSEATRQQQQRDSTSNRH